MSLTVTPITLPHKAASARLWDAVEMQEALGTLLAPFPPHLELTMLTDVCMYNEEGHSLERTIQSLALQQADWTKCQTALSAKAGANGDLSCKAKYMHAWIIADGWRRLPVAKPLQSSVGSVRPRRAWQETSPLIENPAPVNTIPGSEDSTTDPDKIHVTLPGEQPALTGPVLRSRGDSYLPAGTVNRSPAAAAPLGTRILSTSAVGVLEELYNFDEGFGLSLEEKLEALFDEQDSEYVLLQYVENGVLAPIPVQCYDAIHSVARQSTYSTDDGSQPLMHSDQIKYPLFLSVLVKHRNGKKHDSHALFYEAICKEYTRQSLYKQSIQYYFSTDVGTLYAPNMLIKLTNHLDNNAKCAGCCAHQRIMSYVDQAVPGTIAAETAFASFLRSVQAFDFESGLAIFNGLHASMQFLPVLPGPCSLFRACVVTDSMLNDQRAIVTSPDCEDGLISGNLKIAEDRIPSYLVLLQENLPSETHWVPEAVFFFESEDTLDEFIPQRRRWLNGTVAGYAWLVTNQKLFAAMLQMRLMAWKVFGLCIIQLVIFLFLFSMPGQLLITADMSLLAGFAVLEGIGYDPAPSWLSYSVAAVFWVLYVGSFATLTAAARWSRKPVIHWLWYLRIGINAFMMVINTCVVVAVVCISYSGTTSGFDVHTLKLVRVAATGVLLYLVTPLLLTLMHSWASFRTMLGSFFQFYIFLPTILSDFFAYSIAKLDDWSWGTKTAGAQGTAAISVNDARLRRATHDRLSCMTTALVTGQITLMLVFSIAFLALKAKYGTYLIIPGLLPAIISLGIMSGSIFFYFQRAVSTIFSCDRRAPSPEKRVAHVLAAILRAVVFCAWIFVVIIYVWFVLHSYLYVNNDYLESILPDDPLYVIMVLVGALAVLTIANRLYRYAKMPARQIKSDIQKKTRLQTCLTFIFAFFCVLGSVTMVTVVFLLLANNIVRAFTWVKSRLMRLCSCRLAHHSDSASDASVELPTLLVPALTPGGQHAASPQAREVFQL